MSSEAMMRLQQRRSLGRLGLLAGGFFFLKGVAWLLVPWLLLRTWG